MDSETYEVLIFEVAGQRHGTPARDVQELLAAMTIMPVPGSLPGFEGVINLRGVIVPVLNMRERLGLPAQPLALTDHFIVVRAEERSIALHVDRAIDLTRLDPGALAQVNDVVPGSDRSAQVLKLADGMVLLHQISDLLAPAQRERVDRI